MTKFAIAIFSACFLSTGFAADTVILGSVLFQAGAKALSGDEMKAIIRSGTGVETYAPTTGSLRLWVNESSGKFTASRRGVAARVGSNGSGEWKVTDGGQYCVVIEWRTAAGLPDNVENWCRALYRHDGELYLAPSDLASNVDKKYSVVRIK